MNCPPQPPVAFAANAEWIAQASNELCQKHRQVVDRLVATVRPENATFNNVLAVLLQHENEMQLTSNLISVYALVATDASLRAAATEAGNRISHCLIGCKEDTSLFRLVDAVYQQQENDDIIDVESRKALVEERRSYVRKGMTLSLADANEARRAVADIARRLKSINSEFMRNLDGKEHYIWLTRHELAGVPNDALSRLETGTGETGGKLRLDLNGPQARWMLTLVSSPETRQRIYLETRRVVCAFWLALLIL